MYWSLTLLLFETIFVSIFLLEAPLSLSFTASLSSVCNSLKTGFGVEILGLGSGEDNSDDKLLGGELGKVDGEVLGGEVLDKLDGEVLGGEVLNKLDGKVLGGEDIGVLGGEVSRKEDFGGEDMGKIGDMVLGGELLGKSGGSSPPSELADSSTWLLMN